MSTIALESQQYKTYVLSIDDQTRLEVIPERGGIVTRWQVQGQEMFYLDTERLTHPDLTVRGGIPILFPICGNLPDNTFTHNGQPYTLKQHGFARDRAWHVTEQSTQPLSLSVTLTSDAETLATYPFEFELTFRYTLEATALRVHTKLTNRSSEPMPFSIGLHPYFAISDKSQLEFTIPATELYDQRAQVSQPFQQTFEFEQDEIDAAFRSLSSPIAEVRDRGLNTRLRFESLDPYSVLVFWTVKGKPFYCLEPWTAGRNALNTGEKLLHLDPGASLETDFNLSVDRLAA